MRKVACDEVDEAPQDAVLVEAIDLRQARLDLGADRRLLLGPAVLSLGTRVEARVEQRDDACGKAGMLHQRRPHVVLAEGTRACCK